MEKAQRLRLDSQRVIGAGGSEAERATRAMKDVTRGVAGTGGCFAVPRHRSHYISRRSDPEDDVRRNTRQVIQEKS
jgi:hypothetical protein